MLRAAVAEHAGNTPMGPLWYAMPYRDSVSSFTGTRFWEEVGPYTYLEKVRSSGIATYFWGNWRDEPTSQIILSAANLGSRVLVGPGAHCAPPAGFDLAGEIVGFFDHHLKGKNPDYGSLPRATYWVEGADGAGEYVTSGQLPGVESRRVPWFLARRAGAGPSGRLGPVNSAEQASVSFSVDYDLPPADYFAIWPQPMDAHGASFTSDALAGPVTLIGYPVAELTAAADNPLADIFVYLDRIKADGSSEVIAFGRLKMSHRKLAQAPYETLGLPWHSGLEADNAPPAPGEFVPLSIALTPVSLVVAPGDRLRFVITGADPRQRNLKDIRLDPAPNIAVRLGGRTASRIDLPLAP
jgi:putative CocE/NonD family hydrolase